MVTRTFLDKCTTILKDSTDNFGLYPVAMLNHGFVTSRFLIHFDIDNIKKLIEDNTYPDINKIKHTLKMFNCGSIDPKRFNEFITSIDKRGTKKRATSFDVIAFKVPKPWDRGVGFDNSSDVWFVGDSAVSTEGCNWYYSKSGINWDKEGIYDVEKLYDELNKFENGEDGIIITKTHFDYGNEDLELDITDYVNKLIEGTELNCGICLCFAPDTEVSEVEYTQYTGFFTDKTNTFYHPYVETRYSDSIMDNRDNFYIGKTNRLYLYSNIGGELQNLDEMPVCEIGINEYPVTHQTKGVYYADVKLTKNECEPEQILEDVWSNIKFGGEELDDVEMEFVTLPSENHFNIGKNALQATKISPTLNGINVDEKLNRGEIREVSVEFRKPYTHSKDNKAYKVYYRLYVKDGNREITVIDWDVVNMCHNYNYFMVDTNALLPQEYIIDIKVENNRETNLFKKELTFKIVNDATKIKR